GFATVGLVVGGVLVASYTRARGKSSRLERLGLAAVRVAALAIVALCLLRPRLVLSTVVPQRNFLGILIDDSQSMRIADQNGGPRSAFATATFGAADSPVLKALSDKFMLRFFRFSGTTERVDRADSLPYAGRE